MGGRGACSCDQPSATASSGPRSARSSHDQRGPCAPSHIASASGTMSSPSVANTVVVHASSWVVQRAETPAGVTPMENRWMSGR